MPEYTYGQLVDDTKTESCFFCDGTVKIKKFYIPKKTITNFDDNFPNPIHFEYNGSINIGICDKCERVSFNICIDKEFN